MAVGGSFFHGTETSSPGLDGCCGYMVCSMFGEIIHLGISSGQGGSESPQGLDHNLQDETFIDSP